MIKAILIDIDNTLLDFSAYVKHAMRDGFETFGLGEYSEEKFQVFQRINDGLWREIEEGTLTFDELQRIRWNRIFEALGISFDGVEFEIYFRKYLFNSAIPMEGAMEMLEYLNGRYLLCVASNGPYEQQLNRLKVGGMYSYFAEYFISGKIGASKPSKEFFTHCLEVLNRRGKILPSEILMIGDSLTSDVAGAIDSGMKTCFYDLKGKGVPSGMKVDYTVSSLNEIRDIL